MTSSPGQPAIVIPGQLAAVLAAAPERARAGAGNGDCIMLDFKHRIFAVADATERRPEASRGLLERLARLLLDHGPPRDQDQWLELIGNAYARQHYNHKTTLSMAHVAKKKNRTFLFMAHGGDSRLMVINRDAREIVFDAAPDMRFAGRSPTPASVFQMDLGPENHVVVIASDGISDLARPRRQTVPQLALELCARPSLDQLPQAVQSMIAQHPAINRDDLAIIALDPKTIRARRRAPLIIGGTSPGGDARPGVPSGLDPANRIR